MGELQLTKQFAATQKEELSDLYLNRNRPRLNMVACMTSLFDLAITLVFQITSESQQTKAYVIPMSFYEDWTAFIKCGTFTIVG